MNDHDQVAETCRQRETTEYAMAPALDRARSATAKLDDAECMAYELFCARRPGGIVRREMLLYYCAATSNEFNSLTLRFRIRSNNIAYLFATACFLEVPLVE